MDIVEENGAGTDAEDASSEEDRAEAPAPQPSKSAGGPATVMLAPSGAGKSFLVQKDTSGKLVDGDDVVRDTVGWPKEKNWWRDPELKRSADIMTQAAILHWASDAANAGKTVLWNTDPPPWWAERSFPWIKFAAWIPPDDLHAERMEAKRSSQGSEHSEAERRSNRDAIEKWARGAGVDPVRTDNPFM